MSKRANCPRVLYLCLDSGIAALGSKGASVHLRSICAALQRAGAQVILHCNRIGGESADTRRFAKQCVEHRIPNDLKRLQRELRDFYGAELRVPAEVRQALINRHVLPQLVSALRQQKPTLVLERLSLMGVAGVRACQDAGVCHMLEVNALMSEEAKLYRSLADYDSARRAEDEILRSTQRIFCVSQQLKEMIHARDIPAEKVEVLPNGFDETLFRPRSGASLRKRLGLADYFVMGMVGSLKPWHGIGLLLEWLLETATPRNRVALLLVGDGPEAAQVASFKDEHPELKVVHVGIVQHEQVPCYIGACDVCAAPYEANAGFYFSPLKLYEYMAMGKAIIASDQGQIRELIQDGKNGLLFEPGNLESFSKAAARFRKSAQLRDRLGRSARMDARGHTWRRNAQRLLKVSRTACK